MWRLSSRLNPSLKYGVLMMQLQAQKDNAIAELLDERSIRKVKHQYLDASDRFDVSGVLATMTDEVVLDGGELLGRHVGKEAIGELVRNVGAATKFTAHLVANEMIDVNGDSAVGRWWMVVPNTVRSGDKLTPQWLFARSTTRFSRAQSGWLINHIQLEIRALGPHSEGWS